MLGWFRAEAAPCFPAKAFEGLRVLGYILRQELQSNKPSEFDVFSLVDDTHAAATQLLNYAIVRDGLADHGVGPC
jgi:hypothetical protein